MVDVVDLAPCSALLVHGHAEREALQCDMGTRAEQLHLEAQVAFGDRVGGALQLQDSVGEVGEWFRFFRIDQQNRGIAAA